MTEPRVQERRTRIVRGLSRLCVSLSLSAAVMVGCEADPPPCKADAVINGTVSDDSQSLSLSYAGEPASVSVKHKIDVDEAEDRCIAEVTVSARVGGQGCELEMSFGVTMLSRQLVLRSARLSADSFCPGWPDDKEGEYTWDPLGGPVPTLAFASEVPDAAAEESCFSAEMKATGMVELAAGQKRFTFEASGLTVSGSYVSKGESDLICAPTDPCLSASCAELVDGCIDGNQTCALSSATLCASPATDRWTALVACYCAPAECGTPCAAFCADPSTGVADQACSDCQGAAEGMCAQQRFECTNP